MNCRIVVIPIVVLKVVRYDLAQSHYLPISTIYVLEHIMGTSIMFKSLSRYKSNYISACDFTFKNQKEK